MVLIQNMKKCLIISGGEYYFPPFNYEYDYVIACDKGAEYAYKAGIRPDVIIGDFDSYSESKIQGLFDKSIPVYKYPVKKDDTDTMLAIKHALQEGFMHITILCGLGLRMDHTYANIQSMHYAASKGASCEMISEKEYLKTISPADKTVELMAKANTSLSLFALTDVVKNVHINGTEYDCTTDIVNSFPLGHGNHFVSDKATILVEEGILLVIESFYKD